jgi:hypothetical protein
MACMRRADPLFTCREIQEEEIRRIVTVIARPLGLLLPEEAERINNY